MGESGRTTAKTKRKRWPWFLALFGLVFLCVGIGTGTSLITVVTTWRAAQTWVETSAMIDEVKLERHQGDESVTYEVVCTYRYIFDDREYAGDRVGLTTGSDNIGSWQKDTYKRLRRHQEREDPLSCYVDPSDPGQALLDRDLRWEMVWFKLGFVVCFGLVGLAVLVGAMWVIRRAGRISRLQQDYPDEPWRWKPEWQGRTIQTKKGWQIAAVWAFAIFWNAITNSVLPFLLPKALREALIFCLFPFVGLGLLVWAIRMTLRQRRFGKSYLELERTPGVVGGHLRAKLAIIGELTGADRIEVVLKCINRVTTKSSGESKTYDRTIWSETDVLEDVSVRFGQTETRLPIDLQIPYACRPCDESDSEDKIFWELQAKASLPGADLDLAFDVPVFKTAESDPSIGRSAESIAAERKMVESQESPQPGKIREGRDEQGYPCLACSCWPGLVGGLSLFVAMVVFAGVVVFSIIQLTKGEWFLIVFLFGFGLGLLITTLIFISFLGSFRISFSRDRLTVVRNYVLLRRGKTIARELIDRFEYKVSASSGETKYYAVHAVSHAGVKTKVAGMLKGETTAKWLKRRLEQGLGIEPAAEDG